MLEFIPQNIPLAATPVIMLASLATTAVGIGIQYSAQKRAAKATEAAAEFNAKAAANKAAVDNDIAAENARRASKSKQRRLASMRASAAGSGVSFTGSVVDQLAETDFTLTQDINTSLYESNQRQQNYYQDAAITRWEGSQRASAQRTSANASLLTGVGGLASSSFDAFDSGALRPIRLV